MADLLLGWFHSVGGSFLLAGIDVQDEGLAPVTRLAMEVLPPPSPGKVKRLSIYTEGQPH